MTATPKNISPRDACLLALLAWLARKRLESFAAPKPKITRPRPTVDPRCIDRVKTVVARHAGISVADLDSRRRPDRIAFPRMVAMSLCYELPHATTTNLGEHFRRDHGAVLHACRVVKDRCETSADDRSLVDAIRRDLQLSQSPSIQPGDTKAA